MDKLVERVSQLTRDLNNLSTFNPTGCRPMGWSDSEEPSTVLTSGSEVVEEGADEPDPEDKLAAEFSAFRQPIKNIGIIGSRNIPLPHQSLVEALAFMLVKDGNTIYTSGGSSGTNAAAIRGAMRAEPSKLKVILPQTIGKQPPDVQDQLIGVPNIIEHPEWNMMPLADASRLCNREIIDHTQQVVILLFHDSHTLLQAVEYSEDTHKIVTRFFLD